MRIPFYEVAGQTSNNSRLTLDEERIPRTFLADPSLFVHIKGAVQAQKLNNHGTYYDLQVSSIALFLNKTQLAKDPLQRTVNSISKKIQPDGRQPLELRRTQALYYSVFNLLSLFKLASIGEHVGIDLWNYNSPKGAGLEQALQYVFDILRKKTSPYPQLGPLQTNLLEELSCRAILHYHDSKPYIVGDWVRLTKKGLDECKSIATMCIS